MVQYILELNSLTQTWPESIRRYRSELNLIEIMEYVQVTLILEYIEVRYIKVWLDK